ncbi:TPA: hydroxyisourate hydrolase, partial [Klebsiella pneumoniae]
MSTLSTHILDISTGTPAEGVTVSLSREGETLANLVTNAQGRIATFSAAPLPAGRYCLTAETGAWFARAGRESVFTRAQIDFVIGEAAEDH